MKDNSVEKPKNVKTDKKANLKLIPIKSKDNTINSSNAEKEYTE
jgi:hypothetical protein